uniref:BTB domain-containing protein n=1 Tax=Tetraselmis sp. GSL018 TaxID=582737 RepID=A0A061RSN7_9CHLO
MSRCIGVCLSLGALQASLMRQFGEPDTCMEACMLLDSASAYGRLEGALATMELLLAGCQGVRPAPYFPSCCSVMRRNGKVEAIVRVVLDEAVAADAAGEDDATDNEVTALLADLMTYLPRASGDEIAGLAADARAAALNRAKSPATVNPPVEDAAATRGAGFSAVDVNIKRYDSITFIVGGREFYALGWVLEQASARLKRLLAHTDDVKGAVPVPQVDGMPDGRMYELFTLAAEFAYTGYAAISPADALELWSVAACLEMDELQVHCENVVNGMLVPTYETLNGALDLACRYRSGNRLRDLCVIYILDHLMDMHESGRLARLLRHSRNKIEEGMIHVLEDRFLIAAKM